MFERTSFSTSYDPSNTPTNQAPPARGYVPLGIAHHTTNSRCPDSCEAKSSECGQFQSTTLWIPAFALRSYASRLLSVPWQSSALLQGLQRAPRAQETTKAVNSLFSQLQRPNRAKGITDNLHADRTAQGKDDDTKVHSHVVANSCHAGPRAKPASPLCAVIVKRSGCSCQGHQGRNKRYRNSICTEQVVSSALVYQRNSVPRDSATWRTAFFADANVTLSCCSGEECRVPVKPGKNSTEPKRHAQTIMAYKFSRMPASCFMTLWKENRQQVSCRRVSSQHSGFPDPEQQRLHRSDVSPVQYASLQTRVADGA